MPGYLPDARDAGAMPTSSRTVGTLRRFAVAAMAIAPRKIAETIVVTLVLGASEGIGLLLLVPLLQLVGVDAQQGALTGVVAAFSTAFHAVGLRPSLGAVLLLYVAVVWVQGLLQRRQAIVSSVVQQDIVDNLRSRLYRAIGSATWVHFARNRASDYTQLLTVEVDRVGAAAYYLIELSVLALTSLVYVALAFRVSAAMTALVLLCGAALSFALRGRMEHARRLGEDLSASWTRLYAAIAEHLASLKIAKAYGAEGRHARTFGRLAVDVGATGLEHGRASARLRQQLALGAAAVLAALVYVSHTLLAVPAAQLLLLLFLFARLVPRVTGMYERAQALAGVLPAFAVVTEAERRCLAQAEPAVGRHEPVELTRGIAFEHVTFGYGSGSISDGDGGLPAVLDVSLRIAAGATTAIVGPSGGGKSTLADLLMGLLTPSSGRILVDGVPLGPERLAAWREHIGYVAQDPFLFHDTVRANLLWARPDATDDDLWRALRLASADLFVAGLPQGLDTVVGDRGQLVSGGERQRLSLARALVRKPRLLLLDEATSSLDSENEARIQQAIDDLHQQVTIVVITHRLSTIRGADAIHVVERGQLVESGTWDELGARRDGRFRELCLAQGVHLAHEVERRHGVPAGV